jgi:hypothetical protein
LLNMFPMHLACTFFLLQCPWFISLFFWWSFRVLAYSLFYLYIHLFFPIISTLSSNPNHLLSTSFSVLDRFSTEFFIWL